MAEEFLNVCGGGIDFGKEIVKIHPWLKSVILLKSYKKKENHLRLYRKEILSKLKRVREEWRKREQKYIATTQTFFNGFQFPEGKYIAYASIINCNPRFLNFKTFQFFYKKPAADAVHTIAHELLHFIFFDFVKKKLRKEIRQLSEDQLWDLSEIFNVVVLESSRYRNIINQKFVIAYPDHQRHIKRFQKAYENSQNAEEFIRKGIAIIKAKK